MHSSKLRAARAQCHSITQCHACCLPPTLQARPRAPTSTPPSWSPRRRATCRPLGATCCTPPASRRGSRRVRGGVAQCRFVSASSEARKVLLEHKVLLEELGGRPGKHGVTSRAHQEALLRPLLLTPAGRRNKLAVGALFSKLGEDYSHPFKVGGWGGWVAVGGRAGGARSMGAVGGGWASHCCTRRRVASSAFDVLPALPAVRRTGVPHAATSLAMPDKPRTARASGSASLQSGALAYGMKLDERIRVAPNAKLRASREWDGRACCSCGLAEAMTGRRPTPSCARHVSDESCVLASPCTHARLGLRLAACGGLPSSS